MTRKHFEEIARVIHTVKRAHHDHPFEERLTETPCTGCTGLFELSVTLANSFENFNAAFDRARFLKACGYGPPGASR